MRATRSRSAQAATEARAPAPRGARARQAGQPAWLRLPSQQLLEIRLCDLGLQIEGGALETRVRRLHWELERAGLRFRPAIWLSTDWFSPDGVPGFAVPFYLAHPRLARLEREQMQEVEGGAAAWCMQLLRHETAHALDDAYRLHRRKAWREIFGRVSEPYRQWYTPDPASRSYVHNLGHWYAQSHPLEDFAETFAVWLQPASAWRERYAGTAALHKLEYVDALAREIGSSAASVRSRARPDALPRLRQTLREHYRRKRSRLAYGAMDDLDGSLSRLFVPAAGDQGREPAASFLQRRRRALCSIVSEMTGADRYLVEQAHRDMVLRCRQAELRLSRPEAASEAPAAVLLAEQARMLERAGSRLEMYR